MKLIHLALAGFAAVALSACETYSYSPYSSSTDNVIKISDALEGSGATVRLAEFSTASGVNDTPTCRMAGPIEVAPGSTMAEYIREAFQGELYEADAYASSSENTISGTLQRVQFGSTGTGRWGLSLKLESDLHPEGYTVGVDHPFSTSFSGNQACENGVRAFSSATRELLDEAISHPQFRQLVTGE